MPLFDEEPKTQAKAHEIGQDLSMLSADELRDRIEVLRAEIARLEADLMAKGATKAAADALFKR